jgi:hypothetical protein
MTLEPKEDISVYIYGVDVTNKKNPQVKSLLKELRNAGFNLKDICQGKGMGIPDGGYALLFGGDAVRAILDAPLSEVRGSATIPVGSSCLCFPLYAPGYIFRRKSAVYIFRNDLRNAKFWIDVDRGLLCEK